MATSLDFLDAFNTVEFGYSADSVLDIEIQPFFDGSVNIITVCKDTKPRIVNSRQKFSETEVELVIRNDNNLDNVYSNKSIEKTLLIPEIGDLVPTLTFNNVIQNSGKLLNGGYNYYFRLKTADGVESAIIEESRLVSIHTGTEFGKSMSHTDDTITSNAVQFTLGELNEEVYKYISVYYTRSTGVTAETVKTAFHIDKDYKITDGTCVVTHTGFEAETIIDIAEITTAYSPIDSATTVTQKNNRLILGGIQALSITNDVLKTAALSCYVEKTLKSPMYVEQKMADGNSNNDNSYADPYNIYYKTAYFPGETYELALNFVYKNGAVSDAYPIMGFDWDQGGTFNTSLLGTDINWEGSQNSHGVVRLKNKSLKDTLYTTPASNKNMNEMNVYTMCINTTGMADKQSDLWALGVRSYFISRKKRKPDMLMEGLTTYIATASKSTMQGYIQAVYTFGVNLGYGYEGSLDNNIVLFPVPGQAMPFGTESIFGDIDQIDGVKGYNGESFNGVLFSKLPIGSKDNFAFYSPNITSDAASIALINTNINYSLFLDVKLYQGIGNFIKESFSVAPFPYIQYAISANPYRFKNTYMYNPEDSYINTLSYIPDTKRAFASNDFTGKLDRQVALLMANPIGGCSVGQTTNPVVSTSNFRSQQVAFNTTKCAEGTDGIYLRDTDSIDESWYSAVADPSFQLLTGSNYSPYLGLNISHQLAQQVYSSVDYIDMYFTIFNATEDQQIPAKSSLTPMGILSRIYLNQNGNSIPLDEWINKYKNSSGNYFAISERFKITTQLSGTGGYQSGSYLTGGDCYAGFYYQQVWRPGGIDGIPTANNPSNYILGGGSDGTGQTREGVNITNSGYAIGFPVRSEFNFALRAEEKVDDVEKQLYGKNRIYTSSLVTESIRGNRQAETSVINYGNVVHDSVLKSRQFDATTPFLKLEYNNRLVVSEASTAGEFENSYRNFKGLNFKDYDEDLGPITAIVPSGAYVYIVYNNGVSLIEISERTAINETDSSSKIYIGSSDVLPVKSTPIFNNTGAQHLTSVISTEVGIFGVDADAKKIWSIAGSEKKIISNSFMQSILDELITDELKVINSSYDVTFDEITFTFTYKDSEDVETQKSILFDTVNNLWNGTTDINKLYQFAVEDKQLALLKPKATNVYNLYYPVVTDTNDALLKEVGKTTAIDDRELDTKEIYDSYIEFVVKTEQAVKFDLANIIINGTGVPSAIDVITDNVEGYTLDKAATSVSGIEQSTLPVHTNIYMRDATTSITRLDEFRFTRVRNANYKTLNIGDKITLDFEGSLQQFVIANISFDGVDTDTIVLNNAMISDTITAIYYGWKVPIRISLGESMAGKTKLTIPSKKHADLLKGATQTEQNYHVNYANAKPHGRWVKLRLHFEGTDQIYIDSIMSETVLRYV